MNATPSTESVWTRLSNDLRRFIRRRVSDEHVAEDLLQETFVRIHRGVGGLADADRLAAWVYQISRNVIRDHYRTSGATRADLPDDVPDEQEPQAALKARACVWMDELIGELPDTYRDAVRLAEMEGLPHQELADRLGLSLAAAKSRVQRGRVLLKDVLTGCCVFHVDRRGNVVDIDPRPERTVCRDCD
jgi:RNA polymerase sigma-70 factor (ECF subfamily)